MAKFTIATAKKALAAAYPDIEFTYGTAGRGRQSGPYVSWVGGPTPEMIRVAAGAPNFHYSGHLKYHFIRQPTEAEWAEQRRQWDEEHRARVAAEPARRAAAKAAGIEKRKATTAATKVRREVLAAAFPGVSFSLSSVARWNVREVTWEDGPEVAEVAALLSIREDRCGRYLSPGFLAQEAVTKAAKVHAGRMAKRLAYSKVRALRVAKGIERRRTAHFPHLPRLERNPNQFTLPMTLPVWEKPPVYLLFRGLSKAALGVSGRV